MDCIQQACRLTLRTERLLAPQGTFLITAFREELDWTGMLPPTWSLLTPIGTVNRKTADRQQRASVWLTYRRRKAPDPA
jgi:hypothetical protein